MVTILVPTVGIMSTAQIFPCNKAVSVKIVNTACTTGAVAPTVWRIDGTHAPTVAHGAGTTVINRLKHLLFNSGNGVKLSVVGLFD